MTAQPGESGTDQIYAVLVSILNDTLLLPNLAVAEVVARDALRPPPGTANAPAPVWFVGIIGWQGLEVPVISFERMNGNTGEAAGRKTRIVLLNPVGTALSAGRFGLLCEGHPHLVTLNRAAVRPAERRRNDVPELVLARARVASQETVIPDLGAIERALAAVMTAAPEPESMPQSGS